jgi:hypothetical protein
MGSPPDMDASLMADCLQSGCDPLHPATCPDTGCGVFASWLTNLPPSAKQCIADQLLAHTDKALPASSHWADVLDGNSLALVAMVGMVRTTGSGAEFEHADEPRDAATAVGAAADGPELPTTRSHMTSGDAFIGGSHQTLDWNWIVEPEDAKAIDPAYRGIAVRAGHFIPVENELEMGVAAGMWNAHVPLRDGHAYNTHGLPFATFLESLNRVSDAEGFGEIWPTDFCSAFGFERHGASIPAPSCDPCVSCDDRVTLDPQDAGIPLRGCAVGHRYYRAHMGRGLFSPITDETVGSDSDSETAFMAKSSGWPGCPTGSGAALTSEQRVPLGLQDWKECPHRIAYLGRPIIDCGHGDGACEAGLRLEIHPPHVLTMELHNRVFADTGQSCRASEPCTIPQSEAGCTSGVVVGAFGWANVLTGNHLEFDLWPPARPTPDSKLCTLGHDRDASSTRMGQGELQIVDGLGYSVVEPKQDPPCGAWPNAAPPRLTCTPLPSVDPNHLHCVYEDPGAGHGGGPECGPEVKCVDGANGAACSSSECLEGTWNFGNPRMTPRFATSIFEARVFLGWRSDGQECPACPKDGPCPD